jgi:hypothetical protein
MVDFKRNGEIRLAVICALCTIFFAFMVFAPFIFGMDGMDGGFAIAFISIVICLTAAITAVLFAYRAYRLEQIFGAPIAHWEYEQEFWNKWAKEEYREEAEEKKGLLMLVGAICLIVGVAFVIFDPEAGVFVFAMLIGLMVLLAIVAYLVPMLTKRKRLGTRGEVFFGKNGLWLGGDFHHWEPKPIFMLESAGIRGGKTPAMVFEYAAIARYGYQYQAVRLPIPDGKINEAKEIAKKILAENNIA